MITDTRIEASGFTQSPLGAAASEVDRLRQENEELRSKLWHWTEARYNFTEADDSLDVWQRLDAVYEDLVKERDLNAAKAKHEHEWAEDLAKQCCEMEDALGFKQDCRGPSGEFIPTMGPWKERVRDLIAKEGELEDTRKERDGIMDAERREQARLINERDEARAACAEMREALTKAWRDILEWEQLATNHRRALGDAADFTPYCPTSRAIAVSETLRNRIGKALSTACGRGWLSPEVGKSLVEALAHLAAYAGTVRTDRTRRMDEMNIMAEQTLDWCHGLREKCEQADKALSRAKEAGI